MFDKFLVFLFWDHDTREISNIADFLNCQVGLSKCLIIGGFLLGYREGHKCCEYESFHHVVVKVQTLSIEIFDTHSQLGMLGVVCPEGVEYDSEIHERALRSGVIDLDIRQEKRVID